MRLALSSIAGVLAPLALLALSAAAPPALAQPAPGPAPDVQPPSATPAREPGAAPEDRTRAAQAPAGKRGRGLSVAAVLSDSVYGIRGEIELWSKGDWSGGLAAGTSALDISSASDYAKFHFRDRRGVATAGYTLGRGELRLRAQVAFGVVRTTMTGTVRSSEPLSGAGTYPLGEAAVQVHLVFGQDLAWALVAGPVLSVSSQRHLLDDTERMRNVTREYDVSIAVGMRRRL